MGSRYRSPEETAQALAKAKKIKAREVLAEQKKRIRNARIALLVVGILQVIVAAVVFRVMRWPLEAVAIDAAVGLLFVGLYFLSREKPKLAFQLGLGLYGLIQVFILLFSPADLLNGWLIKLIVFLTLFGGLSGLKRIPKQLMDKKETDVLDDVHGSEEII